MVTHPNHGDKPARPIEIVGVGKWPSESAAARELRMTRQEVKAMFRHVDQFETDQTARASTQPAVTVAMGDL